MAKKLKQAGQARMPVEADATAAQQSQQVGATKGGVRRQAIARDSRELGGQAVGSKIDQLIALLRRQKGATVAVLAEALGWQSHSVRGAMSGTLKKRGLTVVSEKTKGQRFYRLVG